MGEGENERDKKKEKKNEKNVAGIKTKGREFWEYVCEFDVIGMAETWLEEKEWEKMKERLPKGYRWELKSPMKEHKKGRAKGGMLMGVKEKIKVQYRNESERKQMEDLMKRKIKVKGQIWDI